MMTTFIQFTMAGRKEAFPKKPEGVFTAAEGREAVAGISTEGVGM